MRYWLNQLEVVQIRDVNLLKEFRNFVRNANGTWSARRGAGFHDDRVMSLVWALVILEKTLVEKHFEVVQTDTNNRPVLLKQLDFGIKYFTNPNSIYNDKDGDNSAMPTIVTDKITGFDDMEMLARQGFKPLQW